MPDESFEHYTIRAHRELLDVIADPAERNAVVKHSWTMHRGAPDEEQVAERTFPPERYELSRDHCVFAEHETVGRDGKPRKYDLSTLAKIVRQHNREIRDVGAFPSITSHHTPEPDDPNGKTPDVLGHAGPFRLGMIGAENPRWAIFCDEYRRADAKDAFDRNPFRSPEVWTFKDGRRRFHPIALVGAENPRLQMPAKYTQTADIRTAIFEGVEVEKYTVPAVAAMPGGSNTFVPSPGRDKRPATYTSDETKPEGNMAADPQIVAQIMAALAETPEFKYLRQCMEKDMAQQQPAPGQNPAQPPAPNPPAAEQPEDYADEDDTPVDPDLADLGDLLTDPAPKPEGDDLEKHTMPKPGKHGDDVSVEKYTQLQRSHTKLIQHTKRQSERLQALERKSTDAERRQVLQRLASDHPYFVDVDEEVKACLYSCGANMSDDQFTNHVATIEKYAARVETAPVVPRGALPERYIQGEADKYEQRLSEEAIKVHGEALRQGKNLDWATCEAEAKKRLNTVAK